MTVSFSVEGTDKDFHLSLLKYTAAFLRVKTQYHMSLASVRFVASKKNIRIIVCVSPL